MNQENSDSKICPICGIPAHKESKYCIFHARAEEKNEEEFKKALKEYVKKIKVKNGNYDFMKFIFVGNIDFNKDLDITVFKNACFDEAIFKRDAYFHKATFEGYTFFDEVFFKVAVSFRKVTFEGCALFDEATFEGCALFDEATFEGDTAINGVNIKTAEGYTTINGVNIKTAAYFHKATFEGAASFHKATFEGAASFDKATFERYALFDKATFEGAASFDKATFERNTYFRMVNFKGGALFDKATFKFKIAVDFSKSTFERNTYFRMVNFKGGASFDEVTFRGDADFRLKYFIKTLNFSKINTFSGMKLFIKSNNEEGKISFERAYLENTYLNIELDKGTFIDFTDALLRHTKIEKDSIKNHILQEKEKEFTKAKEIYLILKNNFHSIGQYEDESWAFKKEKDMERFSQSFPHYKVDLKNKGKKENFPILKWIQKGNFKKWIISAFSNMIYGYGEKPWNVVKTALAIIIIFALSFSLIGIGNPEIIELKGTAIYKNSGNIVDLASKGFLKNSEIRNFPDCLYFSLITFTTLGYGDFRPLGGLGRILAGSEAFLGAIMMALFVYTFARRTGGR